MQMFSVVFLFVSPSSVDSGSRPSSALYTGVTGSNVGPSVQEKQISETKTPQTRRDICWGQVPAG